MPPDAEISGAIVFVVDGINAEVFAQMLEAGKLPAIKKYFADRGTYYPRAVASTPSVTLANLTSLVTGVFPGHHGVTGINHFDRNLLIWRNYETIAQKNTLDGDYTAATIFERFAGATTFSIFYQAHRGATKFVENALSGAPTFTFGFYEWMDRITLYRFNILADVARARRAFPAVTFVYLLAPDFRAYAYGVGSEQYRKALRHTDRQIGRVLGDLARDGLLDKLIIVLTSDHGLGEVRKHFPMERFLRKNVGLDVARRRLWENTPFENRLSYYQKHAAVLYGSGDRYYAICLRHPIRDKSGAVVGFEPWPVRPALRDLTAFPTRSGPVDLLSALTHQAAVDAVAYAAGPNRVRVRTKRGEVEFRQPNGRGAPISHHLLAGDDPLGWAGAVTDELLGGEPTGGLRWGEATADTDYPDLPEQILAYFRARRAGDIAIFAAPGWDFNNRNRAGHGGLRGTDMHVPLLIAGPGVPTERRKMLARTVDIVPTLLQLLGRPVPDALDGAPLVPQSDR